MNVKELLDLKGLVILVTGGAGNYGKCIAEGLAEAGATVVIASRNQKNIDTVAADFKKAGLDVHGMKVDQGNHESVLQLKQAIKERFGKLDGFVNNAVSRPMKNYYAPIEQFAESMQVNATGMMDLLREMADLIIQNGEGGSIINISSMMGMFGPDVSNYEGTDMNKDLPPDYFFHNAGLINLTKFLAQQFAGKNLRVNCISPGGLFNNQPERFLENYTKKVPLRRMANNDDIKGLVVLLSSKAGAYINGENILMDGGLNA
ncbi:MAG: SDR family oxidoreductase [Chitinophagaceae bacterium]|nr:MAG: SDR family oxidoreductase [Chitinophagaceae bacterium]